MKSDAVVWIGCILIFMAGVVWSPILLSSRDGVSGFGSLKETLECISYVATVAACVAAILALKSWRTQFRHSKKFECLARLKLASDNIQCAGRHVRFFTRNQIRINGLTAGQFPKMEERASEAEQAWVSADTEMGRAIDERELFVVSKFQRELFLLHDELSQVVRTYEYKFFDLLEDKVVAMQLIHATERTAYAQCDEIVGKIKSLTKSMRSKEFS